MFSLLLDYRFIKSNKKRDIASLERGLQFVKFFKPFFLKLTFDLMKLAEELSLVEILNELKSIYDLKLENRKCNNFLNFVTNKLDYWSLPRSCFRVLDVESGENISQKKL
jgi:hypothetical protein